MYYLFFSDDLNINYHYLHIFEHSVLDFFKKQAFIGCGGYTSYNIISCKVNSILKKNHNFKKIIESDFFKFMSYDYFLKQLKQIELEYSLYNPQKIPPITFEKFKTLKKKLKKINYFVFNDTKLILSKGHYKPKIDFIGAKSWQNDKNKFILFDKINNKYAQLQNFVNFDQIFNDLIKKDNSNCKIAVNFEIFSSTMALTIYNTGQQKLSLKHIDNYLSKFNLFFSKTDLNKLRLNSQTTYNYFVWDRLIMKNLERNILFLIGQKQINFNELEPTQIISELKKMSTTFESRKRMVMF